jgi:hypothetical protein
MRSYRMNSTRLLISGLGVGSDRFLTLGEKGNEGGFEWEVPVHSDGDPNHYTVNTSPPVLVGASASDRSKHAILLLRSVLGISLWDEDTPIRLTYGHSDSVIRRLNIKAVGSRVVDGKERFDVLAVLFSREGICIDGKHFVFNSPVFDRLFTA